MEHRNHTTIRLLVFAFTLLTACAAATTTTTTEPPAKPATSAPTTTTAAVSNTTEAPKPTAPTPTTTTTVPTTTTTPSPPTLGANCTGEPSDWCKGIDGAICISDSCDCTTDYFKFNSTTCLSVTDLKPLRLEVTDADNSLTITWELNPLVASLRPDFTYEVQAKNVDDLSHLVDCVLLNSQLASECSGLQPGAKYKVNVTVKYTVDGRDLSKSGTIEESLVPADPGSSFTNLTLTAPNVTLSWPPSPGRVEIYSINVKGTNIADVNENTTDATYTVRGLTAGTHYNVTIVAISYNKRSIGVKYTFRTKTAVPGPPTSLIVTLNVSTVKLQWSPPSDPNGDIKGYKLCHQFRVYNDTDDSTDNCTDLTNVTEHNVSGLSAGTFYTFSVYTMNDNYSSTESANKTIRTQETAPGLVYKLKAPVGNTSVNLNWERPSMPNGDIVAYKVSWHKTETGATNESFCLTTPSLTNLTGLCLSNSTDDSIKKNQMTLSYSIDNLEAYTNYTVSVTAYTQKGGGQPFSKTVLTSIAAPDDVTEVNATVLNSTAVNVSWTVPTTRPGPVNYTVSTYDQVFNKMSDQSCEVQGYNSTNCVVNGLEEFWKYEFRVVVKTEAGESLGVNSNEVVTHSGTPGTISNYNVTYYTNRREGCDATNVTVHWKEPGLHQRNTNITKYKFESDELPTTYLTVDSPLPWSDENKNFKKHFDVDAEHNYTLKLYAVGENNNTGIETPITVTTGTCPPPDWSDVDLAQIDEMEQGTTSVTINLQDKLFTNDTQGNITSKGLIVVPEKSNLYKDNHGIKVEDLRNWKASSLSGFTTEYRIELTRDTTIGSDKTFMVGEDQKCKADVKKFCSGPLPESWKFKLAIYSCTKPMMCRISRYVGQFATAARPVTARGSIAWIIALAIVIVLIIAAGSFVFLWYRGIIDPKKWIGKKDSDREEQENFTELEKKIHRPRPIKIADYFTVLEDMHRDTNLQFSDQYDDITKLGDLFKDQSNTIAAKQESNTAKNRWVNILPYDHSRVKLQQIDDDDPTSDYINANYMPGFNTQREYIATQGPLPGTVDDFWRLVWEQNVRVIVMLTQCKEGNRVKCEKYWPDELREPKQYGDVVVNPVSISQLDKYNISIFYVTVNNSTHQVIHFHYLDFPDFSANVEFDHFIEFVRTVRNHVPHDMTGPMIVHCSAGVGRTGTFICVDRLQLYLNSPQFNENDSIDIFDMVVELRKNRVYMVQTESQYIMIHDCFEKMLADKKAALQVSDSMENLYANDAFDPFPEVVYENVESEQQRTEL